MQQHRKRYTVRVEEHERSPYWYARLYLEGEGGRARRWSTGVPVGTDRRISQREATRAAEERAAAIASEVLREVAASNDSSLDSVSERLLASKTTDGRRQRAVDALAFNLDKHVRPYFHDTRDVRSIRRADLEAFKAQLTSDGYAPTSINNALTAIRQVLKYSCAVDELIESVPYVGNVPVNKQGTGKPITSEQAAAFLRSFGKDEREEREFNLFLLNTGLRKAEALAIQWDWIDWDESEIRIPAMVRKGGKAQRAPTPLNPSVRSLLEQRRRRREQPSKDRVWWQLKTYDQARRAAAEKAGIPGYRHHDARHTRATMLAAAGATATDLRDGMGWSTLAMVSRYTHPDRTRLHEMASRAQFGSGTGSRTGQHRPRGEGRATSEKRQNRNADGNRSKFKVL